LFKGNKAWLLLFCSQTVSSISDADDLMTEAKMLVDNSDEAEKLGVMSQEDATGML
jgi:hypothetical protein